MNSDSKLCVWSIRQTSLSLIVVIYSQTLWPHEQVESGWPEVQQVRKVGGKFGGGGVTTVRTDVSVHFFFF